MKKNTILLLSFLFILNACTTSSPEGARVRPMSGGSYDPSFPNNSNTLPKGTPLESNTGNINQPQPNEVGFLNQKPQSGNPSSGVVFPQDGNNQSPQSSQQNSTISPPKESIQNNPNTNNVASVTPPASQTPTPAKPSNDAVKSLLTDARQAVNNNNLSKAASSLERALVIEPKNASIWYDLAQIRLHQGQHSNAERLAEKSINFTKDTSLVKRNWSIIAAARDARGDKAGAEDAKRRAQ